MKKSVCIILIVFMLFILLAGCDDSTYSVGIGSTNYTGVHIADLAGNVRDVPVRVWYDSSVGIRIETDDCVILYLSEGTYIMYSGSCPICERSWRPR